jgi:hypothetical protein
MLLILRSSVLVSASIASSSLVLAVPVVTPAPGPDEFAVPAVLVPGGGGKAGLDGMPTVLGSLPGLLNPPAPGEPDGAPLTPAVPAPAEPADGEPAAPPLPEGPPAAPPDVCASRPEGDDERTSMAMAAAAVFLIIGKLPFWSPTMSAAACSGTGSVQNRRAPRNFYAAAACSVRSSTMLTSKGFAGMWFPASLGDKPAENHSPPGSASGLTKRDDACAS